MRKYLRHPASIPLTFSVESESKIRNNIMHDVSLSGLCFFSSECIENGKIIILKIPMISSAFEIKGKVVWCKPEKTTVLMGIQFINQSDVHKTRMIEQICYIKHYKKEIALSQGRHLSDEQAAAEWISKYAANFPR